MPTVAKQVIFFCLSLLLPLSVVQAQDFRSVVGSVTDFLLTLVPFLATVAIAVFFWGLAQYVLQAGDQEATKAGRQRIVWGIVGLVVIAALWGIVKIIGGTFSVL